MKSTTLSGIGYIAVYLGVLAGLVTSYIVNIPEVVSQIADLLIVVGISIATGTLSNQVNTAIESKETPKASEIAQKIITETKEQQSDFAIVSSDTRDGVCTAPNNNKTIID